MPKGTPHRSLADAQRYYVPEPVTRCWLWQGALDEYGYGRFWLHGKGYKAHRAVYEATHGPIPNGLVVDHICRVKHCVNPDHMEAVTLAVNTQRGLRGTMTHCKAGHPFDAANTKINSRGDRVCKACRAGYARAERARLKLLKGVP